MSNTKVSRTRTAMFIDCSPSVRPKRESDAAEKRRKQSEAGQRRVPEETKESHFRQQGVGNGEDHQSRRQPHNKVRHEGPEHVNFGEHLAPLAQTIDSAGDWNEAPRTPRQEREAPRSASVCPQPVPWQAGAGIRCAHPKRST